MLSRTRLIIGFLNHYREITSNQVNFFYKFQILLLAQKVAEISINSLSVLFTDYSA